MSEVIVRMGFHKNCLGCDLRQIVYGDSYADTDVYCFKEKRLVGKRFGPIKDLARPDWCPIICSLPEGHGRLVDADNEIDFHINDFERVKTEGTYVYSKAYSLSDLCDGVIYAYDHANIIVPADTVERSEI